MMSAKLRFFSHSRRLIRVDIANSMKHARPISEANLLSRMTDRAAERARCELQQPGALIRCEGVEIICPAFEQELAIECWLAQAQGNAVTISVVASGPDARRLPRVVAHGRFIFTLLNTAYGETIT